jgi:hypothetical protein
MVPDWKAFDVHAVAAPAQIPGRSVANTRPEGDTPREVTNLKHSRHMRVFSVGVKHTPAAVPLRIGGDGA